MPEKITTPCSDNCSVIQQKDKIIKAQAKALKGLIAFEEQCNHERATGDPSRPRPVVPQRIWEDAGVALRMAKE